MERQKLLVWSNGKGYHYNFDCVICKKEYELMKERMELEKIADKLFD